MPTDPETPRPKGAPATGGQPRRGAPGPAESAAAKTGSAEPAEAQTGSAPAAGEGDLAGPALARAVLDAALAKRKGPARVGVPLAEPTWTRSRRPTARRAVPARRPAGLAGSGAGRAATPARGRIPGIRNCSVRCWPGW
ncbi:hypothetical protein GCM10027615_13750 [Plantactinospora veratri]